MNFPRKRSRSQIQLFNARWPSLPRSSNAFHRYPLSSAFSPPPPSPPRPPPYEHNETKARNRLWQQHVSAIWPVLFAFNSSRYGFLRDLDLWRGNPFFRLCKIEYGGELKGEEGGDKGCNGVPRLFPSPLDFWVTFWFSSRKPRLPELFFRHRFSQGFLPPLEMRERFSKTFNLRQIFYVFCSFREFQLCNFFFLYRFFAFVCLSIIPIFLSFFFFLFLILFPFRSTPGNFFFLPVSRSRNFFFYFFSLTKFLHFDCVFFFIATSLSSFTTFVL